MKKIFAVLSLATVMVACNNSAEPVATPVDSSAAKVDSAASMMADTSKMMADTSKMKMMKADTIKMKK